ncbi:MAG: DUF2158 domain-containing protein [Clostridiaceae bacterium]|nr:DUF2158 domain-containing protein [Clostridiaceae bacterium]
MTQEEVNELKGKTLKYCIGDVVYLKSDVKYTTPMTIIDYSLSEGSDYITRWLTIQKSIQQNGFPEEALTIKPDNDI